MAFPNAALALTMQEALANVYQTNPELLSKRRQLAAQDEQFSQAISEWRPTISMNYSTGRQRLSYNGAPESYTTRETQSLTVTQPLFKGGGSIARYNAADATIQAGQADLEATTQQVLAAAITSYIHVLRDGEILQLSTDNVAVLEKQKEATSERYRLEEVTRTDVAQANARLARAISDKISAETRYNDSVATFQRIIGFQPYDLQTPAVLLPLPATLEKALEQARAINPVLRRAQQTAEARKQEVNIQKAGLLPTISLQGAMVREDGMAAAFGTTDYDNDSLMLNVSIPLYQSGAEYSRVRQARQNRISAHYVVTDTQNRINERVRQTWNAVMNNRASVKSYSTAVKSAEEAIEGVQLEQLHGIRTVLDVLDAEQELFAARIGLVRAQYDEVTASYNLLAAIGQLAPELLGLDIETYDPDKNLERTKFRAIGY